MTEAEKESRPRNVDLAKYQKVSDDASPAIFRHSAEILRIKNRWSAGDGTSYSVQICHPFERAVLYRLTPSGTLEHRTLARFPQNRQWDCKRTKIVWSAAPPSAPSGSTALVLPTGFPDGSVREIRALTFTMNCDDLVRNGSPHGYPLIYTKQVADIEPWGPQAPPDVPRRLADAQENCTCTKLLGKRMVRARLEMMIYSNSYFLDHLERDWLINLWRCAENLDPDFHLHIEGPLGGLRLRRFTDDDDDDDNSYSVLAHEVAREVMAMTVRRKYYPEPRRTVGDL
ncbi:hypothetical protein EDC01DRAFT_780006 [Geopyxis carbonaria]|nr:hypothetical protein EDC01DRAFT_780006 [Geopyxis carbonaria]